MKKSITIQVQAYDSRIDAEDHIKFWFVSDCRFNEGDRITFSDDFKFNTILSDEDEEYIKENFWMVKQVDFDISENIIQEIYIEQHL
jgi:hypothetical protein